METPTTHTQTTNPVASRQAAGQSIADSQPIRTSHRSRRAATGLVAVLAAAATWAAAVLAFDIELAADTGGRILHISLVDVLLSTAGAAAGAWAVLAVLEKFARRPRRWWLVISAAVGVLSLLGPLSAVTPEAIAALAAFHIVVGGILITGLARTTKRKAVRA